VLQSYLSSPENDATVHILSGLDRDEVSQSFFLLDHSFLEYLLQEEACENQGFENACMEILGNESTHDDNHQILQGNDEQETIFLDSLENHNDSFPLQAHERSFLNTFEPHEELNIQLIVVPFEYFHEHSEHCLWDERNGNFFKQNDVFPSDNDHEVSSKRLKDIKQQKKFHPSCF
jgi:hypothetical protein